jgi:hypothetical protein
MVTTATTRILYDGLVRLPLVFLLLATAALAAAPGDEFLGRWDLTVTAGSRQYPSWLEVTRSGGSLTGRFVGGGGSVRPARVELSGGEIRFSPERGAAACASAGEMRRALGLAGVGFVQAVGFQRLRAEGTGRVGERFSRKRAAGIRLALL